MYFDKLNTIVIKIGSSLIIDEKKNIRGTVIISKEGINGTISGKGPDINTCINQLKKVLKFKDFNCINKSAAEKFVLLKHRYKLDALDINKDDLIPFPDTSAKVK